MKKIILFISLISILIIPLFAQSNYIDVVYLKNGGKITGIIIEQIPGESIKLETKDGGILIFKMSEIEKMVKEKITEDTQPSEVKEPPPPPPPPEKESEPKQPTPAQDVTATEPAKTTQATTEPKFQHEGLHAAFLGGFVSWKQTKHEGEANGQKTDYGSSDGASRFVFTGNAVYQGGGPIAFVFGGVVNSYDQGYMSSYYLGLNYYLVLDQFSPYLYARGGYGLGKIEVSVFGEDKFDAKGLYFNVGGGFKYYIDRSWGLNCELGYAYQASKVDDEGEIFNKPVKFTKDLVLNGFGVSVGFFFYP